MSGYINVKTKTTVGIMSLKKKKMPSSDTTNLKEDKVEYEKKNDKKCVVSCSFLKQNTRSRIHAKWVIWYGKTASNRRDPFVKKEKKVLMNFEEEKQRNRRT
jgi:hypothetical protein